jgi:hypothetical protein
VRFRRARDLIVTASPSVVPTDETSESHPGQGQIGSRQRPVSHPTTSTATGTAVALLWLPPESLRSSIVN